MKTLCLLLLALAPHADYVQKKLSAKKPGFYEANASYLEFKKTDPLAVVINPVLKQTAMRKHADWVKQTEEAQKELGKPSTAWEHEFGVDIAFRSPRLVSVITSVYDYSGGAHPNHWSTAFNFGIIGGKPSQLHLPMFFEKNFKWDRHVSRLVIAKLKKQEGADLVKNDEVTTLTKSMLQNFTIGPTALTWHFNPYEVGPYAAGDFEVKLTFNELGPKFKKSLIMVR
jgi:hypothetical protein